jgi:Zn-dependent peptidase ImmA (M78 family)
VSTTLIQPQSGLARAVSMASKVLNDNYVTEPPVRVAEIAEAYSWPVKFVTWPPQYAHVSGYCDFDEHHIAVNAAEPAKRQRFTIAHELGHAILHREIIRSAPNRYNALLRAPLGGVKDPLEQEANMFAAHLLVPRNMLDRYVNVASDAELSTVFIVSEDVIRYRRQNERL